MDIFVDGLIDNMKDVKSINKALDEEGLLATRRILKEAFRDRWQLHGRTDGGRKLKIIFQLKPKKIVRIITGWSI